MAKSVKVKAKRNAAEKYLSALQAWENGSDPWVTVENPNTRETNRLFIKTRMSVVKGGTFRDLSKRTKMASTGDAK